MKPLQLQVVHLMIKKRRRLVAARALAFSEEKLLAAQLLFASLWWDPAVPWLSSLGAGGKSNMFWICAIWLT